MEEVRPEPPPLHTILKTPATKRRMRSLAVGGEGRNGEHSEPKAEFIFRV